MRSIPAAAVGPLQNSIHMVEDLNKQAMFLPTINLRKAHRDMATPAYLMREFIGGLSGTVNNLRTGIGIDGGPVVPPAYDANIILVIARFYSRKYMGDNAWISFSDAVHLAAREVGVTNASDETMVARLLESRKLWG
ncbi:MAG: hypothetical protein HY286_07705 [Planctomycetes bacterium]|nr:hypothetical protein [Planctomycetota bacterium]